MADLASFLVKKYFPQSHAALVAGGVSVLRLANDYETPFFLYDRAVLDQKYYALRSALPDRFSIYYSLKANPCLAIVKHFLSRGCGIEIASAGELHRALAAGCIPERMLFAGPGKSERELELALSALDLCGIHLFTGTQILDAAVLLEQYRHGMELARRVSTRLCHPLCTLDFGGGLGVPYFPHEQELDLETLQTGLKLLCAEADSDSRFAGTQFLVEPGRFLTAEAGVYVTRVSDVKV